MDWLQSQGYTITCMVYSTATCWVYRGKHPGCPNCTPEVAIKIQSFTSQETLLRPYREIENQRQLQRHSNVVQLFEYFYQSISDNQWLLFLVLEWVEKDLMKDVEQRRINHFPWIETELDSIACDLIRVLATAQELGICHRDIKPQNIFYDPVKKVVKLGDFGSSAAGIISGIQDVSVVGTMMCMSEELKMAVVTGSHHISHDVVKSDVYALGITLLILAKLTVPHSVVPQFGNQAAMLWNEISALLYSDRMKRMIWNMLNPCVAERYTFTQLESEYCPIVSGAVSQTLPSELPSQNLGQYKVPYQTVQPQASQTQQFMDTRVQQGNCDSGGFNSDASSMAQYSQSVVQSAPPISQAMNPQYECANGFQEPPLQYPEQYLQQDYQQQTGYLDPSQQSANFSRVPESCYYQDAPPQIQHTRSEGFSAPETVNQQSANLYELQRQEFQDLELYNRLQPVVEDQGSSHYIANGWGYPYPSPQNFPLPPSSGNSQAQSYSPATVLDLGQLKPCSTSVAFTQDIARQQLSPEHSLGKGRKSSLHECVQDSGNKDHCVQCKKNTAVFLNGNVYESQPVFLRCEQCDYLYFCNRQCLMDYIKAVTLEYALPNVICKRCAFPLEEAEIKRYLRADVLSREKEKTDKECLMCVDCKLHEATLILKSCQHLYCKDCLASIKIEGGDIYSCCKCDSYSETYECIKPKSHWFKRLLGRLL